jgi:site-specific DNA-cytosine methylase
MRQRSLLSFLKTNNNSKHNDLEVYDLFCGAGGFSAGARDAGCRVVFACDNNEDALRTHALNHPDTSHVCCELPCEIPLPVDGRPFHVHGSPPCQKLSQANQTQRLVGDNEAAINLVDWYLKFALASGATSWSMEQVANKQIIDIVERLRLKNLSMVSYGVFSFDKLGVPQTRKRLIAGSPCLIAKLICEAQNQPRRSIKDVILHPRGTHVRGRIATFRHDFKRIVDDDGNERRKYKKAKWADYCRPIKGAAPTVLARHALLWITADGEGKNRSALNSLELAALQTFPPTYIFPKAKGLACSQIGNAVPPRVAELMLR